MKQTTLYKPLPADSLFMYWFNSQYYHKLYQHRDDKEAEQFVNSLLAYLQPGKNARMLDVGCGAGRHCRFIAAHGFDTTGIDLSGSSIRQAKKHENSLLRFFLHDMRMPIRLNYFDFAFNFFTSFGYFQDHEDNLRAMTAMAMGLKPGGRLVIDYLNVQYEEENTRAVQNKEIDGTWYQLFKWSDSSHFYKKILIEEESLVKPLEYIERVAKLRLEDFMELFSENNLELEATFGDYNLGGYIKKASPRMIMIARKKHCVNRFSKFP